MIKIKEGNLNNRLHQNALFTLLNVYIKDKMGGGTPIKIASKKKLINGLSKTGNSLIYFALYEKKFVGMAICFTSFATFKLKKLINIHDLIVLPEYRNKKIGKNLMNHIEKKAKQKGFGKLTLEVREDNINAKHLYKSLGYNDCNPPMLFWIKNI